MLAAFRMKSTYCFAGHWLSNTVYLKHKKNVNVETLPVIYLSTDSGRYMVINLFNVNYFPKVSLVTLSYPMVYFF